MSHGRHRKPKGVITVTGLQLAVMILFGSVGVLMVLAANHMGRKIT